MNTQTQLGFITDKIQQLQTAILHCYSGSILKLPTSIAKTVFVDEVGCVWVVIRKPSQYAAEFDRHFLAGLNYYSKGKPFYLKILGSARLVIDPEELNQLPEVLLKENNNENLILCIRIQEASYFESPKKSLQSIMQRWMHSLASLFIHENNYYHFNLSDEKNYA